MTPPRLVFAWRAGPARKAPPPLYLVSFSVHVFLLVLVIVAPSLGSGRKWDQDAVVAELVGSVPTAPPSKGKPAPAVAPKPTQAPPPKEGVRAATQPVKPPDPKKEKPPKKQEPKPREVPDEPDPAPAGPTGPAEAPGVPTGPASPQPTGPPGTAGGITSLDGADLEFAWYRAQVTSALRSRWVRPILEDASGPIAATVVFDIRRDGSVVGVRVDSSSGVPVMDRSVLRAVLEAAPLPALPSAWRESVLSARYEFRFQPGEP